MSRHHKRLNNARWARVRRQVLNRDNWRCRVCGKAGALEVDHITRIEDGGAMYDPANLQSLCKRHHRLKTLRENRPDLPTAWYDWQETVRAM